MTWQSNAEARADTMPHRVISPKSTEIVFNRSTMDNFEYHRARRYIVLGVVESGFAFRVGNAEYRRPTSYSLWPVTPWPQMVPVNAHELNLIATGERAEEIA